MPQKVLITSALPSINGIKHLGTLVGCLLPSDIYARYMRARGNKVLFICGNDEHGTPTELAAQEEGLPVREFADKMFEITTDIYRKLDISFDHFGRTSRPQNYEMTQHFAKVLEENGLIEERTMKQIFSIDDNRFLPDRYVWGTCPHCGYDKARGDQCENCTKVLDPTDLINPHSAISGSTKLEVRESKHLFLRLSKLSDEIRAWLDTKKDWPKIVTGIGYKWLDEGLSDRCITRDLSWGVPVLKTGYEHKVFYVWFDNAIGYISATKEWSDIDPQNRDWERWWKLDKGAKDVYYVQFMGKDNLPFHTVNFPAALIGSGEGWKLADYIKGVSWMNYYNGKFSTSQHRGVFMDQAVELFPSDYWRYYLISNAPESDDTEFSWELFAIAINKELADLLGNLYSRVGKLTETHWEGKAPELGKLGEAERESLALAAVKLKEYEAALEAIQFRKAMQALRELWGVANQYMEKTAPWKTVKVSKDQAATSLAMAVNFLRLFAVVSAPVVPASARKIAEGLGLLENEKTWPEALDEKSFFVIPAGRPIANIGILFKKITPEEIVSLKQKFGGELAADAPKQRGKELHIGPQKH